MEEWRPIDGWPYEVSNLGRVKSCRSGNILKLNGSHKYGYLRLALRDFPRKKAVQVSPLVATAFIRAPLPGEEADHIDENTSNNSVDNLRWLTVAKNRARRRLAKGESHHYAKLTAARVKIIRRIDDPKMDKVFAERFGCARETVRDARNCKLWRHV